MRFVVQTTPPPDDKVLSPLLDARVTALELRDAVSDDLISRARFDPPSGQLLSATRLDLGPLAVTSRRDLRMLALGAAGQQALGVALTRDAEWNFGDKKEILFALRRPLFFFGGSRKLEPPYLAPMGLEPGRQRFESLLDESFLRVLDPNSVTPLLTLYHRKFDMPIGAQTAPPVSASAGTFDGVSLLVATVSGNLHVVDTLQLRTKRSVQLPAMPPQHIVVQPMDLSAAVLHYTLPAPDIGLVGKVLIVRDLVGLRSGKSDGNPLGLDIESTQTNRLGPPLSAVFAPDGMLDVLFSRAPLEAGTLDCARLDAMGGSTLRRYDPQTGAVKKEEKLVYTTVVAYNEAKERVLVQPCTQAPGATRRGQVRIEKAGGALVLAAPGVADIGIRGAAIIAVGRDDIADSPTTPIHATVNLLEANASSWATSQFDLQPWQVPFRVTTDRDGKPYTSSVQILFAPTDLMVYSVAITPDRARALALVRVTHKMDGVFLSKVIPLSGGLASCFIDWSGYTYHVLLVNLQTGAREQDYMVGVQNLACNARQYDDATQMFQGNQCFTPCDPAYANPYLRGYQEGYIPSAASVLFGRH